MRLIGYRFFITGFLVFLFCNNGTGKTFRVNSAKSFEEVVEDANPGDSIIWEKGSFSDVNLKLTANGIYFLAEDSGKTIFTGSSSLEVSGNENVVSGFQFIDGKIKGNVVDVSGNKTRIEQINIQNYDSHYYLCIRPNCQYNMVNYCNFESKPETQESSVVQVEAAENLPGYHKIAWCSFKNFTAPHGAGGDYGIEALRIGYSYQAKFISRTIVEYCYFTKCNGDGEIVSNKARENIFRYNTFENNGESHFTLRHGKDNVIYGNFFLNGAGIRIKEGQNQMIYNNYFQTGERFAIMLVNYKVDPLENIIIAHNTFVSSGEIQCGGRGDFQPKNVVVTNNLFLNSVKNLLTDLTGSERFSGNVITTVSEQLPAGFKKKNIKCEENKFGFLLPKETGNLTLETEPKLPELLDIPTLDDDPFILLDILKQKRTNHSNPFPGCLLPSMEKQFNCYATPANSGPVYLHSN